MNKRRRNEPETLGEIACAVYCRKSVAESQDSSFTSIDNQRDAGEAYVRSQAHLGWVCLPDEYSDHGISGGTLERPALKRLLADVEGGKVKCIVVQRLDRFSRSLLDFANMVALLDRHGVSFASVNESFSTKTSVGRMTMNLLATFAEFERSLIRERTRDKMHAAKRRGRWVGGMLPLGFNLDTKGGLLVENETEAETVRTIFSLYADGQSLADTLKAMEKRGIGTKRWVTRKGRKTGGGAWTKTRLSCLLGSAVYIGKVEHRGTIYDGEHPAIVPDELWHRVQGILRRNSRSGGRAARNRYSALLRGILHCGSCETPLVHTYTARHGRRYRYYKHADSPVTCPTKTLPASEVEAFVVDRIRSIGKDKTLQAEVLKQTRTRAPHVDAKELAELLGRFTPVWESLAPREQARALHLLVSKVVYDGANQTLAISFRPNGIHELMEVATA